MRLAEGITQVEMVLRDAACALHRERQRERDRQREREKAFQKETESQRERGNLFQTQSLQLVDEHTRERLAWQEERKVVMTAREEEREKSRGREDAQACEIEEKEWLMHQVAALRAESADAQAMLDECEELLLRRQVEAEEMKLQHLQGVFARNKLHTQEIESLEKTLWGQIEALTADHCRALQNVCQEKDTLVQRLAKNSAVGDLGTDLGTYQMLVLETSSSIATRIGQCDTLVDQVEQDLMSAQLWCVDTQKRMHAMRQTQAVAEALAHQHLQVVNGCEIHRSRQVEMIAALHADKLALSYSVETKLECLIAAESHNADLQRRLEATAHECMELCARLQGYKERGHENGDAQECAAGLDRSLHGEEDGLSAKVAAREEEIRAQCYTQFYTQLQQAQALEEDALEAQIEQADETLNVLVVLTQRVQGALQQASAEQQQQQQQQSEQQLLVEEQLHAAQETVSRQSETVSKQQAHLACLKSALKHIQKKMCSANLPVQLHAFVDHQCAGALEPPEPLLSVSEPGAASHFHAQAGQSRAWQLLPGKGAVHAMQTAQEGSGGVFSQEASPPRHLRRGEAGGENEAARVKNPSSAAFRTPCASWQKFVELRSHELSKSQSTQAHASPWTRATTPQDVHVLRHISFATSPAPLPSTPEAEGGTSAC